MYPLWLCPFMLYNKPGMVHPAGDRDEMYVDIGAYGAPTAKGYDAIPTTRNIEAYVRKVKG